MKRIDRHIILELLGPWIFGVAIFTALIMAGSFLFKLTDYVVKGIDFMTILKLTALLLPGVVAKTFPMAVLLASLLGFGRLSSDSEIVAIRAAGVSLPRIMWPVMEFGLAVSLLAFAFNEIIVPRAAYEGNAIQQDISRKLDLSSSRPTSYPIYEKDGRLVAQVTARNFSISDRSLTDVSVNVYDKLGHVAQIMIAPKMEFQLTGGKIDIEKSWRLTGGSTVMSADGQQYIRFERDVWPSQVPHLGASVEDIAASSLKDLDAFSMSQTAEKIAKARADHQDKSQIANLEYGYWNKIALPFAALIYALVGAPLGIRNHRTGAAAGFWLSVVIIFGYMMLANFLAIYAQGGKIPPWVASFAPLVIGLIVASVTIARKNH